MMFRCCCAGTINGNDEYEHEADHYDHDHNDNDCDSLQTHCILHVGGSSATKTAITTRAPTNNGETNNSDGDRRRRPAKTITATVFNETMTTTMSAKTMTATMKTKADEGDDRR